MVTAPRRLLTALLVVATLLGACTPGGQDNAGRQAVPIGDEPLEDDEVTLHLAQPPELPDALAGATITSAELRTEERTAREIVQLVDVPTGTTALDAALPAGAVLRLADGQSLDVGADVEVAVLASPATEDTPGTLGAVDGCAAPCTVEGPALVVEDGWFTGFGVVQGWQLLVPSPVG